MKKITTLIVAVLTIATFVLADGNPFETKGGKFKFIPGNNSKEKTYYIEFKDGKYSVINGPSGYYTFEDNFFRMIRNDDKSNKVIFFGTVTKNDGNFIRVEAGGKNFHFYRCSEKVFADVKRLLIASSKAQ